MKNIFILIFILIGCNTAIKKNVDSFNPNKINVSKSSNISLLNRIRAHPGIYIEGAGENAKVYTRGVSSINNQKEILFVLNGVQVGNYSQVSKILNPSDIKNITILRNASNIAFYGFRGSGGVILIETE